jgi:hypothetical protein
MLKTQAERQPSNKTISKIASRRLNFADCFPCDINNVDSDQCELASNRQRQNLQCHALIHAGNNKRCTDDGYKYSHSLNQPEVCFRSRNRQK